MVRHTVAFTSQAHLSYRTVQETCVAEAFIDAFSPVELTWLQQAKDSHQYIVLHSIDLNTESFVISIQPKTDNAYLQ